NTFLANALLGEYISCNGVAQINRWISAEETARCSGHIILRRKPRFGSIKCQRIFKNLKLGARPFASLEHLSHTAVLSDPVFDFGVHIYPFYKFDDAAFHKTGVLSLRRPDTKYQDK